MDLEQIRALLQEHISPLSDAIVKLERQTEKIVDLLVSAARTEESLKNARADITKCINTHDEVFVRLRALEVEPKVAPVAVRVTALETTSRDKMWDALKLIGAAALSLIGALVLYFLTRA